MNKRAIIIGLLFILPTSLIAPAMGTDGRTSGRVNNGVCEQYDPLAMGGILTVEVDECAVYVAGEYAVGTVLQMTFDVSSTQTWDLLIFEESDYRNAYENEQENYPGFATKYTTTMFGITSIDATFRWMTTSCESDDGMCHWMVVIDNRDLTESPTSGVDDAGQGLDSVTIRAISAQEVTTDSATLVDDVFHANGGIPNAEVELGYFDSGTTIFIEVIALKGRGDVYPLFIDGDDCLNNLEASCLKVYQSIEYSEYGGLWIVTGNSDAQLLTVIAETAPTYQSTTFTATPIFEDRRIAMVFDTQDREDGGDGSGQDLVVHLRVSYTPIVIAHASIKSMNPTEVNTAVTVSGADSPNSSGQIVERWWTVEGSKCIVSGDQGVLEGGTCRLSEQDTIIDVIMDSPGTVNVTHHVRSIHNKDSTDNVIITFQDTLPPNITSIGWVSEGLLTRGIDFIVTVLDNYMLDEYTWYVDGQVMDSGSFSLAGPVDQMFSFSPDERGEYLIQIVVTDKMGFETNYPVSGHLISFVDDQDPEVKNFKASASEVLVGEKVTLDAGDVVVSAASDATLILYCWDLDHAADGNDDGDAVNDCDRQGRTIEVSDNTPGEKIYTLTVSNQDGFSTKKVLRVNFVEEEPWFSPWMILLPLVIIGMAVGFIQYKSHQDEMMMKHIAEAKQSQDERREVEERRSADDPESQKAMFAKSAATAQHDYAIMSGSMDRQRQAAEMEMARLAGIEQVQEPVTVYDLMSVRDDGEEHILFEAVDKSQPDWVGSNTMEEVKKGDDLDDLLAAFDPYHDADSGISSLEITQQAYSSHRAECAACTEVFAVDLPLDAVEAVVDCPECKTRQRFRP